MPNILAIDPGTQCGWALAVGTFISSGYWNLKEDRFSGGGMRFLRLRHRLDYIHENTPLDQVVFEEVRRHKGVDAAHAYGGYLATITSWCEEKSIPYQGIPVGEWKKVVTGKGNASKEMVMACVRELGWNPDTEDQADALAILHFWIHCAL